MRNVEVTTTLNLCELAILKGKSVTGWVRTFDREVPFIRIIRETGKRRGFWVEKVKVHPRKKGSPAVYPQREWRFIETGAQHENH